MKLTVNIGDAVIFTHVVMVFGIAQKERMKKTVRTRSVVQIPMHVFLHTIIRSAVYQQIKLVTELLIVLEHPMSIITVALPISMMELRTDFVV